MSNELRDPQRPLRDRLLHTIAEVLLSFALAGGLFLVSYDLMCRNSNRCNDFGGIAFMIASLLITVFVWGWFLSLCRMFRRRLGARIKLDATMALITISIWIAYILL